MAHLLYICLYCNIELTKEEAKYHRQNQFNNNKCYDIKPNEKKYIIFEEDYE